MRKNAPITLIFSCIALLVTSVFAEKAQRGLYSYNSFGASFHPLGVLLDNRLYTRLPLSSKSGVLWESTKLDLGLQSTWTPADELIRFRVTLEPIAVFSLTGTAGFYGMYNTLGYGFYPFSSKSDHYGPGLPKGVDPQSAAGAWCSLSPELKMKAGHFIFVNTFTANFISLNRSGYFLELRNFALHMTKGADIINDANLLYEFNTRLLAGFVYHYLSVFGTDVTSQRLSALAIRPFPASRFGNAFLVATAGYYPADPAFGHSFYIGAMIGTDFKIR